MTVQLFFLFLFGSIVGSFLNVLIHRIPLEKDWIRARSACPKCNEPIAWYFNIPILGYIALRGKCANCKGGISPRYPLVELLSGLGAVFLAEKISLPNGVWIYSFYYIVLCIFFVHFFIDLKHKILPNGLNLLLGILFVIFALVNRSPLTHWLLGFFLGLGLPLFVTWAFYKLRGKIGLGGGDIKLFAVLGLFLGPVGVIQNIFLSSFIGAILGLLAISLGKMDKNNPLSFGPFILSVAFFQIYFPSSCESFFRLLIL